MCERDTGPHLRVYRQQCAPTLCGNVAVGPVVALQQYMSATVSCSIENYCMMVNLCCCD